MATYFITRHAWLQRLENKISVSNVSTMRRILLDPDQLSELEHYAAGAELREGELSQRLLDADLLVAENGQAAENPRLASIFFAIDKYLAERHGMSRSRLLQRHPDQTERLGLVAQMVTEQLSSVTAVRTDKWQRRSGVDDFLALLDHVRTFLREDAPDPGPFLFPPGYLSLTAGRPLPRYDYEQQPCMPATTVKRVQQATGRLSSDSRGLILGDDDLIGLYWSGQLTHPADVFELDTELITFLEPHLRDGVSIRKRDLTKGLPEEFCGLYDVVFTDPMYRADGMDLFMLCAASGLSSNPDARVYFSTRPDLIQRGGVFAERLAEAGLVIETRIPNFSRYRMPDFSRKLILRDFRTWQAPLQLVEGLLQVPYFYADLFVLKKAEGTGSTTSA